MFRATVSSIFRSTLTVHTAFGTMYCNYEIIIYKFYLIEPSLPNTIDSCYSTTGYMSNMFRPCLAIIRLTKFSIN